MTDFFSNIIELPVVDSTNNYLKEYAAELPDGTVVIAEHQTAGRGRFGNVWKSDECNMLMMSVLLKQNAIPADITLCTAVAVSRAIESVAPLSADIKWANDIIVNEKKICGILCENKPVCACDSEEKFCCHNLIIGIGINVNTTADFFAENLLSRATSLAAETSKFFDKKAIRNAILLQLSKIQGLTFKELHDEYVERCISLNRSVSFLQNGQKIDAISVDINEEGQLVCKQEDKLFYVNSGEVHVDGLY